VERAYDGYPPRDGLDRLKKGLVGDWTRREELEGGSLGCYLRCGKTGKFEKSSANESSRGEGRGQFEMEQQKRGEKFGAP